MNVGQLQAERDRVQLERERIKLARERDQERDRKRKNTADNIALVASFIAEAIAIVGIFAFMIITKL